MIRPFHLAIPVANLEVCRTFYRDVLQCKEGRYSDKWVDFDFFGHQFVIHQKEGVSTQPPITNAVDGFDVPVPHFGVVLEWDVWHQLANSLTEKGIQFVIDPYIRFKGKVGEQATMFFYDPEGNAIEFKAFKDISQLFAN